MSTVDEASAHEPGVTALCLNRARRQPGDEVFLHEEEEAHRWQCRE
jgi:hypothetical protein